MTDTELRLVLIVLGAVILLAVYWIGRKRAPRESAHALPRTSFERLEPSLGRGRTPLAAPEPELDGETEHLAAAWNASTDTPAEAPAPTPARVRVPQGPLPGIRPEAHFERIVTLHVMANDDGHFAGPELVVAAEKASLVHGDRGLFHRLVDGRPELGPIFSIVNRVQPGHFDLSRLDELRTPGISLFMTLPGPLPALDAWERMLPVAQRLAELLKGTVYDEQMNAVGRQRIASIRDELRAWDRKQDRREIRSRW